MPGLRLVVGLGNPGRQYARTRHNAGFIVVDALADQLGVGENWKTKDGARQVLDREHGAVLVEPLTYMNDSGTPTQRIAAWHKVPAERVIVIVDDLDLPFGKLRMRLKGSSGGHNGLKSLIAHFGEDFARLRIGIGRDRSGEAIDRVLGTFSAAEEARLPAIVSASLAGIHLWLDDEPVKAVQAVNSFALPA